MPTIATESAERRKSNLKNTTAGVEPANADRSGADENGVEPANPQHLGAEENFIIGYGPLAEYLTGQGFPISKSTVSKYCSPAMSTGPPIAGFWGRLAAFIPSVALDWAKARIRPADEARSRLSTAARNSAAPKVRDGASNVTEQILAEARVSEAAGRSRIADKCAGRVIARPRPQLPHFAACEPFGNGVSSATHAASAEHEHAAAATLSRAK
jgi:hypothetical protein